MVWGMSVSLILKKNTMKEQANDVFEICTYVDGLEKKIVSMTEELTSCLLYTSLIHLPPPYICT